MSDAPQSPFDDQSGNFSPPGSAPPPPPPGSAAGPSGFQPPPPPGYVSYAQHQAGPGAHSLASPGKRILARIIDGVIFAVLFLILAALFGGSVGGAGLTASSSFGAQLVGLAVVTAYQAAFLSSKGATPGKMAMSIKVVFEDGRKLDLHGALMRLAIDITLGLVALVSAFLWLSNLASLVVTIVSLVFLFTHDRRQAVWDRVAKTIVINS